MRREYTSDCDDASAKVANKYRSARDQLLDKELHHLPFAVRWANRRSF